jgi:PAS domain S-box-containing protein
MDKAESVMEQAGEHTEPAGTNHFSADRELAQRARRLSLVNELSLAINQLIESEAVWQAAVDGLARVLDVSQCGLALFNEDRAGLTVVAERSAPGSPSAVGLQLPVEGNPSMQRILATKAPQMIADAQTDPRLAGIHEVMAQRQVASILIVPLLVRDQVIGTIGCDAIGATRHFSADEVTLAQTVANLVAARIENTRLYEAEQRRRQEAETLREATVALVSSLDLKQLLEEILVRLNEVIAYDSASIFLLEDNQLRVMAARGPATVMQSVGNRYPAHEDTISRQLAQMSLPLCIRDIQADPRFVDRTNTGDIRGWMGVPLIVRERFIGYLALDSRRVAAFGEAEANLAQAFARQAAIAMENARLFWQVQEQAASLEIEVANRTVDLLAANHQLQREVAERKQAEEALERRLELEKELERRQALAYELGRQLTTLLDPQQLLHETVYRLRDAFGYYHVHVYLLAEALPVRAAADDSANPPLLLLMEGTGEPAEEMKRRGHTIPLNAPQSLVALAARTLEPVIVNDIRQEPTYLPNPLLPATRSEVALPLSTGQRLFGVLDVQHRLVWHFDNQEIRLLQIVASQLSVALANARLFSENSRQLAIIEQAAELIALGDEHGRVLYANQASLTMTCHQRIEEIIGQPITNFYAAEDIERLRDEIIPIVMAHGVWRGENRLKRADGSLLPIEQTIFTIQPEPGQPPRLATMITDITERKLAEAERESLLETEQKRAGELSALVAAGTTISASLDVEEVLTVVAQQMAELLQVEACAISAWDTTAGTVQLLTEYVSANWEVESQWYQPFKLDDYPATRAVLQERTPAQFRFDDPQTDPAEHSYMAEGQVKSLVMLPLVTQDRTIGLAELIDKHTLRTFSRQELALAQTLANQAAAAIENARLFEAERRRSAELEALRQASLSLTSSLELQPVLEAILDHSLRLAAADNAHVFLYDGRRLSFGAALWAGKSQSEPIAEPRSNGLTYTVARSGQRIVIPNVSEHPFYQNWDWGGAIVGLPLKIGSQVRGVMNVAFVRPHQFDNHELRVLELLADQAALALQNARLFEATRRQVQELTVLHAVAAAGSEATGEDALVERATEIIGQSLFPDNFGILLPDEAGEYLRVHPSYRIDEAVAVSLVPIGQGITGHVVATGRAYRTGDTGQDPLYRGADSQTRSELCVPLLIGEQVIGVINAESRHLNAFSEADELLLTTLAGQLATAIQKVRLLAAERRQLKELTALHAVALTSNEATDENALIEAATTIVGEALYPNNFGVLLLDEVGGQLVTHPSYRGQNVTIPIEQGITGRVARVGQPVRLPDARLDPDFLDIDPDTRSELCVPLLVGRRVIGVINAESRHLNAFSEADERFLTTLASQLATAVARARLFAETKEALAREQRLNEVAHMISGDLELPTLLRNVVRLAAELVGAEAGILGLISADGAHLEHSYSFNLPQTVSSQSTSKGQGIAWQVVLTGWPVVLAEYRQHPQAMPNWVELGVHAMICVPVLAGTVRLGAISLFGWNPAKRFTPRDLAVAESAGRQAGVAIQNARLYSEAQQRAEELALALARQEELDRLKSEFIQNVSHELRTPLSIVHGYAELLGSGEFGELLPEQVEPINIIVRRVQMLTKLVDDFTAILSAEAQAIRSEAVELEPMVKAMLTDFLVNANKAGVNLASQIQPAPPVFGDPGQLRRIFDNLLGNALKFTPAGGQITVKLWPEDESVLLEVADTGIGIPPDQIGRVFERFYQVDGSMTRRYGGTGLGLALVKEIVEAHGGKVQLESSLGQGSKFRIRLPRYQ